MVALYTDVNIPIIRFSYYVNRAKSVQIRSYFWFMFSCIRTGIISGPYFPVFGLDTEIYTNPNAGKYGPEITPYLDAFHAVVIFYLPVFAQSFTYWEYGTVKGTLIGKRATGKFSLSFSLLFLVFVSVKAGRCKPTLNEVINE